MSDLFADRLIEAIYRVVSTEPRSSQKRVILTTLGVRRRLRHLLEREFPQLPVLSTARRNYAASSAGCGVPNLAINLVFV